MLSVTTVNAQGFTSVLDISTGVKNGTSNLIAFGSQDDTWKAYGPGSTNGPIRPGAWRTTYVCSNINGAWAIANCARWITPYLDPAGIQPFSGAYAGEVVYGTTIQMDFTCLNWAQLNFSYIGGDNNITGLSLNGHAYTLNPSSSNDYNPLTQNITVTINPAHLHSGANTLIVKVNNTEQSYTGFYLCGNLTTNFCN